MTVKRISNNQKNISNGVTCKSGQKRKNEINLSIQPKPKQLKSDAKNDDPYLNVKDRQSTSIIVDVLASTIDNASRGKIIDVTGKTWTLIKQINDNKADPQLDNIQSKKKTTPGRVNTKLDNLKTLNVSSINYLQLMKMLEGIVVTLEVLANQGLILNVLEASAFT